MKRLNIIILIVLMTILSTTNVFAIDFESKAKAAILTDENGQILYEKNVDSLYAPASITKLMTYLLTMEAKDQGLISLEDRITISENAAKERGATYWLVAGEKLKLKELIDAMMVASANDATMAIAEHVGGSEAEFVEMMNKKALSLGMKNTHFSNPNGMPEEYMGNLMTARDINILAKYLIKNHKEELLKLTSMKTLVNEKRRFTKDNTNKLLKVMPKVDGLKTGYTEEAGYCLVSTMPSKGFRLISVVLGTDNESQRLKESKALLEFGDKNFAKRKVIDTKKDKYTLYMLGVQSEMVEVIPKEDIWRIAPNEYIKSQKVILKDSDTWKVRSGDIVGELQVELYNGEKIKVDLISNEDKSVSIGVFFKKIFTIMGCIVKSAIGNFMV